MFFLCSLILGCTFSFAQNITITIALRGEKETIKWNLTYDFSGMITSCRKSMISTDEVIESLVVTTTENGFLSEYKAKALTMIRQIVYKKGDLAIISLYQNSITNSDETSHRLVIKNDNEIVDIVNDFIVYKYDVLNKKLFGSDGHIISERQGDIIYNHDKESQITIIAGSEYIELQEKMIPAIVPPTLIKISGDVYQLKKSQMINYSIIPYELQFLLFLM
jgi:hypothetical protein